MTQAAEDDHIAAMNAEANTKFDDPADDARAEAGADADDDFGSSDADQEDFSELPADAAPEEAVDSAPVDTVEAVDSAPENQTDTDSAPDSETGVYNMETGQFEKAAVLLQTDDVDDQGDHAQASDDSDDENSDDTGE